MKARKITENESTIWASGTYLCEYIPVEFFDWEEDKQDKFLTDNAHESVECASASFIWEQIDNLAWSVRENFVKEKS
tara:strand:- start:452 stop:682 length:231 start_codon:yes stop_codon:yes gene_type:complete